MADTGSKSELKATYVSPTDQRVFSGPLADATAASRSTSDKTAYLTHLRAKVALMQDDVNDFLTQKMEEDKTAASDLPDGSEKTVDEDKEEDMYGEEDPEGDS